MMDWTSGLNVNPSIVTRLQNLRDYLDSQTGFVAGSGKTTRTGLLGTCPSSGEITSSPVSSSTINNNNKTTRTGLLGTCPSTGKIMSSSAITSPLSNSNTMTRTGILGTCPTDSLLLSSLTSTMSDDMKTSRSGLLGACPSDSLMSSTLTSTVSDSNRTTRTGLLGTCPSDSTGSPPLSSTVGNSNKPGLLGTCPSDKVMTAPLLSTVSDSEKGMCTRLLEICHLDREILPPLLSNMSDGNKPMRTGLLGTCPSDNVMLSTETSTVSDFNKVTRTGLLGTCPSDSMLSPSRTCSPSVTMTPTIKFMSHKDGRNSWPRVGLLGPCPSPNTANIFVEPNEDSSNQACAGLLGNCPSLDDTTSCVEASVLQDEGSRTEVCDKPLHWYPTSNLPNTNHSSVLVPQHSNSRSSKGLSNADCPALMDLHVDAPSNLMTSSVPSCYTNGNSSHLLPSYEQGIPNQAVPNPQMPHLVTVARPSFPLVNPILSHLINQSMQLCKSTVNRHEYTLPQHRHLAPTTPDMRTNGSFFLPRNLHFSKVCGITRTSYEQTQVNDDDTKESAERKKSASDEEILENEMGLSNEDAKLEEEQSGQADNVELECQEKDQNISQVQAQPVRDNSRKNTIVPKPSDIRQDCSGYIQEMRGHFGIAVIDTEGHKEAGKALKFWRCHLEGRPRGKCKKVPQFLQKDERVDLQLQYISSSDIPCIVRVWKSVGPRKPLINTTGVVSRVYRRTGVLVPETGNDWVVTFTRNELFPKIPKNFCLKEIISPSEKLIFDADPHPKNSYVGSAYVATKVNVPKFSLRKAPAGCNPKSNKAPSILNQTGYVSNIFSKHAFLYYKSEQGVESRVKVPAHLLTQMPLSQLEIGTKVRFSAYRTRHDGTLDNSPHNFIATHATVLIHREDDDDDEDNLPDFVQEARARISLDNSDTSDSDGDSENLDSKLELLEALESDQDLDDGSIEENMSNDGDKSKDRVELQGHESSENTLSETLTPLYRFFDAPLAEKDDSGTEWKRGRKRSHSECEPDYN